MDKPIYQDLSERTAIVTGAGSCIGRAIAKELALQGMYVWMLDISQQGLEGTMQSIGESTKTNRVKSIITDVSQEEKVRSAYDQIKEAGRPLDVVVNNAGIPPKKGCMIADLDLQDWDRMDAVNVRGYIIVTKYAEQLFRQQATENPGSRYDNGSFIYICSNAGIIGSQGNAYGITNGARLNLMKQVAKEMASYGVRSNAVIPGNIIEGSQLWNQGYLQDRAARKGLSITKAQDQYEKRAILGKKATPEQVAKMVASVALPEGPFQNTTGKIVSCDGGELIF